MGLLKMFSQTLPDDGDNGDDGADGCVRMKEPTVMRGVVFQITWKNIMDPLMTSEISQDIIKGKYQG